MSKSDVAVRGFVSTENSKRQKFYWKMYNMDHLRDILYDFLAL